MTPHTRSSTLIGAPTEERNPQSRAVSATWPEASVYSIRAGRCVRATIVLTLSPPGSRRNPDGQWPAGIDPRPRTEDRQPTVRLVPAENREVDPEEPPGLLRDAGEHVLRRSGPGDECRHVPEGGLLLGEGPQLHTGLGVGDGGVPISSVKPASRSSAPVGNRSSRAAATFMTPHNRPSTLIGAPTTALKPQWWA